MAVTEEQKKTWKKRGPSKEYPKLRPEKDLKNDGRFKSKHGFYSLDVILKAPLDKRLTVVKMRDALQAKWIDYAGGPEHLSPPILALITRIVHAELKCLQAEKMSMLGEFDLTEKRYQAISNSQTRHIVALENLLKDGKPKRTPSLADVVAEMEKE